MSALILRIATTFLLPLIGLLALFLFLRGHDRPGGGFPAGLVLATAVAVCALGAARPSARQALLASPAALLTWGLVLVAAAALAGPVGGDELMKARWLPWKVPVMGGLSLGSPILFDLGLALVTVGGVLLAFDALAEGG